jgi:hypothetical protein
MKKWTKQSRAFLNPNSKDCLAAVSWSVSWAPGYLKSKHKFRHHPAATAEIYINKEGQSHYINEKKDMRAIQTMMAELNKFEEACQQMFVDSEEWNATNKVTD